jgi:hypothetical protein
MRPGTGVYSSLKVQVEKARSELRGTDDCHFGAWSSTSAHPINAYAHEKSHLRASKKAACHAAIFG